MKNIFSSGEIIENYKVKVVNENEVRASAGILFLFAIISFMNSWLIGDFVYTKIFVIVFLIEFAIRVLINPKYAPSLILSKIITRGQKPLYTGAVQKRFAWSIGLILAILMTYLIVLNDIKGPINLFTCLFCLMLLFFEAAFGICIGCKIYKLFKNDPFQECPDGKCEVYPTQEIQKTNIFQLLILTLFFVFIYFISSNINNTEKETKIVETKTIIQEDCQPPQWAIDMGHGEKWKLHHGCK